MTDRSEPTRRGVLSVGAVAALGAGTLSACSSEEVAETAGSVAGSAASAASSAASGVVDDVAATLSDIPVGGAVVKEVAGKPVVLAQPEAGNVVAFSGACTHQGCKVTVKDAKLVCPCHGSEFEIATGAVTKGPATADLAPLSATIDGDGVTVG